MRRLVFAAITLCLALGVGWFLIYKDEKSITSQETEKPRAAATNPSAQTSSAQTSNPEGLLTEGTKPSQVQTSQRQTTQTQTAQPTTPTQTNRVPAKPSVWASGAVDETRQKHQLHMPGEGLPAATQEVIRGLIQQATALEDKGDLPGAIDANKKVLDLDRKAAVTMNVIAALYGKLGDFRSEADWTRKAIALDPHFTEAYINLGNAMGSAGRPAEARKAFGKVIALNPKSPLGVYSLGVVAERQFKFRKALGYYEESTKIDPRFENGYYNAASMHANLKEYDAAMAALDKLLQLNPNAEDAKLLEATLIARKAMVKPTAKTKPTLLRATHKHRSTHRFAARKLRASAKGKHRRHHRRLKA